MSRVNGLVIDSLTQTENAYVHLSEIDESTQTDQHIVTQSDEAKASYNDESTQTDYSVNTSCADALASYNDENDSVKTTCVDESNITEEKNCEELNNHHDFTSQLCVESSAATAPLSFIQAKA